MGDERQQFLDDYAATSRAFADAVERLRKPDTGVEGFIRALAGAGTAHRACERARIRLEKHLSVVKAVTARGQLTK